MKPQIKAILFDYDDTLVRSRESVWQAHKIAAKKFFNLEFTDDHIGRHWGKPFPTMMADMYGQPEPFDSLNRKYQSVRKDYPMQAYEESVAVINLLLDRVKVGIVTAATLALIEPDIVNLKIPAERLVLLQTADDTTVHKPDPKVFEPALKKLTKLNIEPAETMYVGDDIRDFIAANGAGLQFVGVVRNGMNPFAGVGTDIVDNLWELEAYL